MLRSVFPVETWVMSPAEHIAMQQSINAGLIDRSMVLLDPVERAVRSADIPIESVVALAEGRAEAQWEAEYGVAHD